MIVVQTGMTEIPEGCKECLYQVFEEEYHDDFFCLAKDPQITGKFRADYYIARPEWCPLMDICMDEARKE